MGVGDPGSNPGSPKPNAGLVRTKAYCFRNTPGKLLANKWRCSGNATQGVCKGRKPLRSKQSSPNALSGACAETKACRRCDTPSRPVLNVSGACEGAEPPAFEAGSPKPNARLVRVEGSSAKSRILRCAQNLEILVSHFIRTLCLPVVRSMCSVVSSERQRGSAIERSEDGARTCRTCRSPTGAALCEQGEHSARTSRTRRLGGVV